MFNRKKKQVRCYHCDEVGHFKRDCPKLKNKKKQEKSNQHEKNQEVGKEGKSKNPQTWVCMESAASVDLSSAFILD